jgi:2'-5' RNA ligase
MYEENDYSTLRFEVTGELRHEIVGWGFDNIDDKDVYSNANHPHIGREDKTHCTVMYNITDTAPEQVLKVLAGEPSFTIELGDISVFENEMFDVIKVDVRGDALNRLYRVAVNSLSHNDPYFDFNPHLTIAFVKRFKGKKIVEKIKKNKFAGKKFKVEELCFNKYRSNETIIDLAT